MHCRPLPSLALVSLLLAASGAVVSAQAPRKPAPAAPKPAAQPAKPAAKVEQVVKPPVAQAWIDVATFSGFGMPSMGDAIPNESGGGGMAAAMGAMMGGRKGPDANEFLRTQSSLAGRWMDVTVSTRENPALAEATQAVPEGLGLAPSLKLQSPQKAPPPPATDGEVDLDFERPKGKLYLYWGCGAEVREGQPKVLDLATATPEELGKFFQTRHATQRGAHSAAGRPVWPSRDDRRLVPAAGSLVGEHAFAGQGIPEGFRFTIPAAQDFMPAITLTQEEQNGAHALSWNALESARAYFVSAMGARGEGEMVLWTSSEVPDAGFGLVDYQTNAAVDRWLGEKVLLAPSVTSCTVPRNIFGEEGTGMVRMIAYGSELNLVHPPRPADPAVPWEQSWAVKVRVKSVANAILGMDMSLRGRPTEEPPSKNQDKAQDKKDQKKKGLRGMLGVIKPGE